MDTERLKEFTNVTFDEIRIGDKADLVVTMKQNQIDVAAIVSGDVDAFYLKGRRRFAARREKDRGGRGRGPHLDCPRHPPAGSWNEDPAQGLEFLRRFRCRGHIDFNGDGGEKHEKEKVVVFEASCVDQSGRQLVSGKVTVQAPDSRLVYDNIMPAHFELRWGDAFADLIKGCEGCEAIPCAVVHPCEPVPLKARSKRQSAGSLCPCLSAPRTRYEGPPRRRRSTWGLTGLFPRSTATLRPQKAVELARSGEVEALMKGSLHTDEIMGAIVPKSAGLRTSRRVSHVWSWTFPRIRRCS